MLRVIIVIIVIIIILYFYNIQRYLYGLIKENTVLDVQQYNDLKANFNARLDSLVNVPVGAIVSFMSNNIPHNYMICDGTSLAISEYENLYAVIGRAYTPSNVDASRFNLPDLRSMFLRAVNVDERELGSIQMHSTALPTNKFITTTSGSSVYNKERPFVQFESNNPSGYVLTQSQTNTWGVNVVKQATSDAPHSHNVMSGGDIETRPINIGVHYIIKCF